MWASNKSGAISPLLEVSGPDMLDERTIRSAIALANPPPTNHHFPLCQILFSLPLYVLCQWKTSCRSDIAVAQREPQKRTFARFPTTIDLDMVLSVGSLVDRHVVLSQSQC